MVNDESLVFCPVEINSKKENGDSSDLFSAAQRGNWEMPFKY